MGMAAVMAETDEGLRKNRANRLINGLSPEVLAGLTEEMVPDLLQLFQDVRYSAGASLRTLDAHKAFVGAWARLDPEAATRYAADRSYSVWKWHPGGNFDSRLSELRRATRKEAIAEWAKVDLVAAKQFAAGVKYKYTRNDMTLGLMRHLAETDLDGAIGYSAELEAARDGASERLEISYLVEQVREQRGMDGVKQWLESVDHVAPDDRFLSYKQSTVVALAESLREKYSGPWSEPFMDFLAENGREPFLTAELLAETASGWTPTYTLERLLALPEEVAVRREAVGDEMQELVNEDPEYAGKWLNKQKLLPVHDEAIQVYVREATMEDVDVAMRWAEQITDPVLRNDTINYVRERGGQ